MKVKNVFSRRFFHKILPLRMVSIQEGFLFKSGLWWLTYGRSFQAQSILVGSILVVFASMKIRMILQKLFQSNLLYLFFYTNCAAQCTSKCKTFVWSSRKSENTIGTLNCWKSTVNFLKQSWFWKKAICHPRSLNSIRSRYVCFSFGVYHVLQCFASLTNM